MINCSDSFSLGFVFLAPQYIFVFLLNFCHFPKKEAIPLPRWEFDKCSSKITILQKVYCFMQLRWSGVWFNVLKCFLIRNIHLPNGYLWILMSVALGIWTALFLGADKTKQKKNHAICYFAKKNCENQRFIGSFSIFIWWPMIDVRKDLLFIHLSKLPI